MPRTVSTRAALVLALVLAGVGGPSSALAADPAATPRAGLHPLAGTGPATAPAGQRLIVRYRPGTSNAARRTARTGAAVVLERSLRLVAADVVRPDSDVSSTIAALEADPSVESVSLDQPLQLDAHPTTEPDYGWQWALENPGGLSFFGITAKADVDIDAEAAWPIATGDGVVVAVLDDGIDFSHPDLAGQAWVNPVETDNGIDDDGNGLVDDIHGANICDNAGNPADDGLLHVPGVDYHGTAVASVIAGAVNDQGIAGIAPDARIMGVRFLIGDCASEAYAVAAVEYAVEAGAKIINASWGGSLPTPLLDAAIAAANAEGVLFVAAAGNRGSSTRHWPAASSRPNVLSVGALRANGGYASFSNYGSWVDMAAPGAAIRAANADPFYPSDWAFFDGTSFAAPYVAGVAALIAQAQPELLGNPIALRAKLLRSGWRGSSSVAARTAFRRVLSARNALDFSPPVQDPTLVANARVPEIMGTSSLVTNLVWPHATDDVAIDSYRVRLRRLGGSTAWLGDPTGFTSRSVVATLMLSGEYELDVYARDAGGSETSFTIPLRARRYQETTSLAAYAGTWRTGSSATASGGALRYSSHIGDTVTFAFTGRGVALFSPRGTTRGSAKVYVDGDYVRTISLYASTTQSRRAVFSEGWTEVGPHTVTFELVGPAGRPRFDVDAFVAFD